MIKVWLTNNSGDLIVKAEESSGILISSIDIVNYSISLLQCKNQYDFMFAFKDLSILFGEINDIQIKRQCSPSYNIKEVIRVLKVISQKFNLIYSESTE